MSKLFIKTDLHTVTVTHPDRLLFPEDGITKSEFIEYYRRIAGFILPQVQDRPINMFRFHGDITGKGFFQQRIPARAPEWVERLTVKKAGGTTTHILCNTTATLIYLANLNCITPHIWLSRADRLDNPDQMVFDLDPGSQDFEPVRRGARLLKTVLDELGLRSFLKTSGSRGLHVMVPLDRREDFEKVRRLAQDIAAVLTSRDPERYTVEQRIEKRKERLFIDTLRNTYGHTIAAPYAVRAKKGAPVAAPLLWEELDDPELNAQRYNVRNIFQRLEQTGDPWGDEYRQGQSLAGARRKLKKMKG
jgi:bifunctional non-homologous end joining protein LigD